jgi:hypothetical protein
MRHRYILLRSRRWLVCATHPKTESGDRVSNVDDLNEFVETLRLAPFPVDFTAQPIAFKHLAFESHASNTYEHGEDRM